MCTRKNAKKSQVLKIVRPSSHVKKNFYELWKFIVDLAVHLGGCRWNFWMRRAIFRAAGGRLRSCACGVGREAEAEGLRARRGLGRLLPRNPPGAIAAGAHASEAASSLARAAGPPFAAARCPPSAACRCPQPPAACRCPLSKRASFAGPQARIITNDKLMTWHDAKPPHAKPPRCGKNRRKTRPF